MARHLGVPRTMRMDRMTTKSQEALREAVDLASRRGNPELVPEHLLLAMLDAGRRHRGSARSRRRGRSRRRSMRARSKSALEKLPQVTRRRRAEPLGRRTLEALRKAPRTRRRRSKTTSSRSSTSLLARGQARPRGPRRSSSVRRRSATTSSSRRSPRCAARSASPTSDPEGKFQALEKYTPRSHRARARGQDRSGHRPRRRDPPRDAGALAAHEEQPGAHRRARRRQDGHRRGHRPAHRQRRRARVAEGQAPRRRSIWPRWSPARSSAASSRIG